MIEAMTTLNSCLRHRAMQTAHRTVVIGAFVLSLAVSAVASAKDAASEKPATIGPNAVDVGGEEVRAMHVTLDDLAKLPHVHVNVHASAHGVDGEWDGVPLIDILRAAGAPTGESLRGRALALYVRVRAADDYRVVFALGEIDPSTGGAIAILADRHDGKPLGADEGPLRMILPGDKRPARWVRQVAAIDLLRAPE
jgi:DMSO/TMAO reductase YedYZ molybdopterin-dependent catalytic subunit